MNATLIHNDEASKHFITNCAQLGHLLYWYRQGGTRIEVRQQQEFRWLLLNHTLQSVIAANQPQRLLLPHLHIMAQYWQTLKRPERVLELGLGGGAIRNYLLYSYPEAELVSVEHNAQVIHCYKRFFSAGKVGNLCCLDAEQALNRYGRFDWLVLDLFSELDAPLFLYQRQFYELLREALVPHGHIFINFLAHHPSQLHHLQRLLSATFGKGVQIMSVPGYANHVCFISL
ncbi:fused MFS/spermidine synthase [Pseudoalteromonas sp. BDTF-M6]|uniref:spermidine synthase n=1 Tax=Pseudoalteromonas sp. BDTF-M6 TaxID=2796132 RepID=UPI001BAF4F11|nr:fused MFS/spermidine synthase [Pseudoalteromonas sp. BDTF-M6]MBS3799163.1 fused MFS/spermidine synthase [Pseudoalteromonas sp. BDTF-M6]